MRKLASIQNILALEEISGCDNIVLAQVLGWSVIVKRGEFNIGDQCVYCEIDSILPEREEFEFLRSKHFRIKTMKMKGVYSQGICFPLSVLPAGDYAENDDVTEIMGITKWEPELDVDNANAGKAYSFPSHLVPPTDETRIQSFGKEFAKMQAMSADGHRFVATLKVDGSSMTIMLRDSTFRVCSHHSEKTRPQNNEETIDRFWLAAINLDLEKKLRSVAGTRNIAVQGELAGPGIQRNRLKLNQIRFFAFYAFDQDTQQYLQWDDFVSLMDMAGIDVVPIVQDSMQLENFTIRNNDAKDRMNLLDYADQLNQICSLRQQFAPGAEFEGVVIAYTGHVFAINRKGDNPFGRFSVKVVSNKYLLKE